MLKQSYCFTLQYPPISAASFCSCSVFFSLFFGTRDLETLSRASSIFTSPSSPFSPPLDIWRRKGNYPLASDGARSAGARAEDSRRCGVFDPVANCRASGIRACHRPVGERKISKWGRYKGDSLNQDKVFSQRKDRGFLSLHFRGKSFSLTS